MRRDRASRCTKGESEERKVQQTVPVREAGPKSVPAARVSPACSRPRTLCTRTRRLPGTSRRARTAAHASAQRVLGPVLYVQEPVVCPELLVELGQRRTRQPSVFSAPYFMYKNPSSARNFS